MHFQLEGALFRQNEQQVAAEVADQGGYSLVKRSSPCLQPLYDAAVHIPTTIVHGHETATCLAEPSSKQQLFTQSLSIALASLGILFLYVEGLCGIPHYEIESLLLETVQTLRA